MNQETIVQKAIASVELTKQWKEMSTLSAIFDPNIPAKAQVAYEELEKAVNDYLGGE